MQSVYVEGSVYVRVLTRADCPLISARSSLLLLFPIYVMAGTASKWLKTERISKSAVNQKSSVCDRELFSFFFSVRDVIYVGNKLPL